MNDQTPLDDLNQEAVMPEVEAEAPKPDWTEEDAAEARAFGWKAPDEWAGEKPSGYIDDPRRYLERAESFRPFRALREKFEREKADFDTRIQRMEKIATKTIEAQRAQYDREMAAIRRQQLEAVDTADRERYDALEKQKEMLARPPELESPAPAKVSAPDPDVEAYTAQNEWVRNPVLRKAGADLIDANGWASLPPKEQLRLAEQEVRKLYPGAFPAATPAAPTQAKPMVQRVDGGGLGGAGRGGAFSGLPPEAKNAFKRFVEQGIFSDTEADRKRYADDYNA